MSLIKSQNFTSAEISHLREAGQILASLFRDCRPIVRAGVTGKEINTWFAREIKSRGAHATYLNPDVNFPGVICISPNDVIVHGVPTDEPFATGDIVSFDLVIDVAGMKADSAFTMLVNDETPTGAKKILLAGTEKGLYAGIAAAQKDFAKSGLVDTRNIAAAVEQILSRAKLGVVRELVGHGIGRDMHENPDVPNFAVSRGDQIPAGNAFAIEPMATLGGWKIREAPDHWTIRTRDSSLAAHFEHTAFLNPATREVEIITAGGF